MTSRNRISIKEFDLPYLEKVGTELGMSADKDLTEIVARIISDHRRFSRLLSTGVRIAEPERLPAASTQPVSTAVASLDLGL